MPGTYLLAGNPSKLLIDLAHEALSRKDRVLLTTEPDTEAPPIPAGLETGLHYVEWNRRSPISARFVILQAVNQQIELDHAILVLCPRSEREAFHASSSSAIEEKIDFDLKGYAFLLREVLANFLKQGHGSITFLLQNTGPEILPPFEAMVQGAFQHLGESMISAYAQERLSLRGVDTPIAQNRQVAEFVLSLIAEDQVKTRGKWTHYTGKSGLFSRGH